MLIRKPMNCTEKSLCLMGEDSPSLQPLHAGSYATPSPRGFAPKTPNCLAALDAASPFLFEKSILQLT